MAWWAGVLPSVLQGSGCGEAYQTGNSTPAELGGEWSHCFLPGCLMETLELSQAPLVFSLSSQVSYPHALSRQAVYLQEAVPGCQLCVSL